MTGFNIFGFRLAMAICLSLQMSGITEASGTLELKLNNFQNPTEHLRDGSCCDLFCAGGCDDIFHFSLDQSSGSTNDPQSYSYWTKVTGTYQDQNNVYFNDNMNDVANPIIWNFDSWPGTVLFKVYIEDDDQPYTGNDYLDGMVQRLTLTPARSKSSATVTTITMSGLRSNNPTSLSMTYKLYCNDNYYGASCSVNCVAQDTDLSGHYTCDPDTGAKICRPGVNCERKSCTTDTCLNGGSCTNTNDTTGHRCLCPESFTGPRCQSPVAMPSCKESESSATSQPKSCDDNSDGEKLLIILPIVCIILFIIAVVVVAVLIYRRRRNPTPRRIQQPPSPVPSLQSHVYEEPKRVTDVASLAWRS